MRSIFETVRCCEWFQLGASMVLVLRIWGYRGYAHKMATVVAHTVASACYIKKEVYGSVSYSFT